MPDSSKKVAFVYTNYRGERGRRVVTPEKIYFGTAPPWHPEETWLMEAYDHERGAVRTFDMSKIELWGKA